MKITVKDLREYLAMLPGNLPVTLRSPVRIIETDEGEEEISTQYEIVQRVSTNFEVILIIEERSNVTR